MKPLPLFEIGQCWTSEGEPELGVGFVRALDEMSVAIEYPSSTQGRMYRKKTAPLRRLEFRVGEKIQSKTGKSLVIERIETRANLIWYINGNTELCESDLSPNLPLQRPIERFLNGKWDPLSAFVLRRRSLEMGNRHLRSPARGFMGPRAQLLPHQLYVTSEISKRGLPRALLADEVGLGKTIEAGWIMHRLIVTGRIKRVLIIVPETLVNQWFVELFRRFNLSFWVPNSQTDEDLEAEDLESENKVILSTESLVKMKADDILKNQSWDLVIVDEAHRVSWGEGEPSEEYKILKHLAALSPGLLLLTATPEQLGLEGHFSRLHLIDPQRFQSLETFEKEHSKYLGIVKLADRLVSGKKLTASDSKALLKMLDDKLPEAVLENLEDPASRRAAVAALIDHFGTGRVYFRNSRSIVQLEGASFPTRTLQKHVLKANDDETANQTLTKWLAEFAATRRSEKLLLICSSAKKVVEWEKVLRDQLNLKVVAFHEGLAPLARDRNAAYFEDPKGAMILLCSEIGGEGRNFQQASHLILPDLPEDPDALEQRIGRLDRIGQKSDITLHVPFFKGSREERLLRWHDEVFDTFRAPPKGAGAVYEKFREELEADSKKGFGALIDAARGEYLAGLEKIEAGRDRLIELNSFDADESVRLREEVISEERPAELQEFMETIFNALGITSDSLDPDSLFIEPGHSQYAAYVPGLPPEGISFTFSRARALARTDLQFMTWDHPMLLGTLESIAAQEFGNVSVAAWANPFLIVECSFTLTPAGLDAGWYADEFFPTTPLRVVLEATGKDLTAEWDWEKLKSSLTPLNERMTPMIKNLPSERIRGLLNKGLQEANKSAVKLKKTALQKMSESIDQEVIRLQALRGKNKLVSDTELRWWNERKIQLTSAFDNAQVTLDSFLLVVPSRVGE